MSDAPFSPAGPENRCKNPLQIHIKGLESHLDIQTIRDVTP